MSAEEIFVGRVDDTRRFMPEHDRQGIAQRSLDHFEIDVAQPGGADPNQHVIWLQCLGRNGLD